MRIFKHWVSPEFRFDYAGQTYSGRCFGGSNVSEADALGDARSRWEAVVERIQNGRGVRAEDYAADIREEVLREIDPRNVVTRNRYGAEVLNSENHLFLDVDQAPWQWKDLLGSPRDVGERQARIVAHVKKVASTGAFSAAGIRIYGTPKGVRLLVSGVEHSPRSPATMRIMKALNVDRLYMALCRRQECYRARLTPKPSGIKIRTPRCVFPRDEAADRAVREWVSEYDAKRRGFAACRLLETIGAFVSTPVSEYHDQRCRAAEALPLA